MSILKTNHLFIFCALIGLLGLQSCGGSSGSSTSTNCSLGGGANVTVSGKATFDRVGLQPSGSLDFNNISQQPVKGAVVEAICNGTLTSTNTDTNGNYSLAIPGNTSGVFIRVKAQLLKSGAPSWDVSVSDETQAAKLVFSMDGSAFSTTSSSQIRNLNASSGWNGVNYEGVRAAAPFAILDTIYDAMQIVLNENANTQFPLLDVKWSATSTSGTFYSNNTISVLGRTTDTDEFDEHVIAHEWGHYFQDAFSRDDSIGGPHSSGDVLDMRVAFSEGFGNAFSAIVTGDAVYKDSQGLSAGFIINVESNSCSGNVGWFSECSVQSVLYDFYDVTDDGADLLSLGFSPMYTVLTSNLPNTDALTSIFSFITPYKSVAGNGASIDALLFTDHSIATINDDEGTGRALDPGSTVQTPVFETAFPVTSICLTGENGGYNGLGVTRFVQFTPSTTKSYKFVASKLSGGLASTDPDIVIRAKGQLIAFGESTVTNSETLSVTLSAGVTYVLELSEYLTYGNPNYSPSGGASDTTCFSITQT